MAEAWGELMRIWLVTVCALTSSFIPHVQMDVSSTFLLCQRDRKEIKSSSWEQIKWTTMLASHLTCVVQAGAHTPTRSCLREILLSPWTGHTNWNRFILLTKSMCHQWILWIHDIHSSLNYALSDHVGRLLSCTEHYSRLLELSPHNCPLSTCIYYTHFADKGRRNIEGWKNMPMITQQLVVEWRPHGTKCVWPIIVLGISK
jgi:hypothetical protein